MLGIALAFAVCEATGATTTDPSQESQASVVLTNESAGTDGVVSLSERYRVEPVQVDQGPQIDGYLDEYVWQRAAIVDDFVQQEPSEGDPATERTVARLLHADPLQGPEQHLAPES